ncbi:unnamed protein product [Prorocentrum cordatum]|uniref:Uncharacterized protein n=1 Tax=Prorocentrum cordatum TaxID=2364126 RepID=A0ABN9T8H0_9DINO|nr:unnamed protein product [Polarella glacialis]
MEGEGPSLPLPLLADAPPEEARPWSPAVVLRIGGGWLVWKAVREGRPWWWALAGCAVLAAYGFVPTLQPIDDFGRLYAVYGGVFIGMSFAWGRVFDGVPVDMGDAVGSAICLVGIAVILFWPRQG